MSNQIFEEGITEERLRILFDEALKQSMQIGYGKSRCDTKHELLDKLDKLQTQFPERESDEFDEGCLTMKRTVQLIISNL